MKNRIIFFDSICSIHRQPYKDSGAEITIYSECEWAEGIDSRDLEFIEQFLKSSEK